MATKTQLQTQQDAQRQQLADRVRASTSPETSLLGAVDDLALRNVFVKNFYPTLLNTPSQSPQYPNQWVELQYKLRQKGFSKGKSDIGLVDIDDIKGLRELVFNSSATGIDYMSYLDKYKGAGTAAGGPTFSKQIATALQYKDATDAAAALNDAYFQTYNTYPSAKVISDFKTAFNKRAELEAATTTTTTTTSGAGTGAVTSKQKVLTSGQGFTAQEQQQFMADYLAKNFNVKGVEGLGGRVRSLYLDITNAYKANNQPVPAFQSIAPVIKDIIGTGDETSAKQKLENAKQKLRDIVARQYIGIADALQAGNDYADYAQPYANTLSTIWEKNVDINDKAMKEVLNYNDGKTYRAMNAKELEQYAKSHSNYKTTSAALRDAAASANAYLSEIGRR